MSLLENLRRFISIIDKMRDIGLDKQITLPRIVVLGTQSSGKSSLLESIVGLDFLPRGEGLVTRRPLEMRLINVPQNEAPKPYAIFEELKGEKFDDFDIVTKKIEMLTDKVAGANCGIVNQPIIMTIYSNSVPDLTLVDLPGITRIPLKNSDQGQDIEKVTKDMALHYIKEERTIILCVISANQDLSTSDALMMARQIDPTGIRSLGVLTKIDIMDRGTNAKKILLNNEISLNLGYVGVKLRSQQDILDKLPVQKAIALEKEFFATHPVYSSLPPGHTGIESLTSKLTKILYTHIRRFLPQIIHEIKNKISEKEKALFALGKPLPATDHEKFQVLYEMVQSFTGSFRSQLTGKYNPGQAQNNIGGMSGSAKFRYIFNGLLQDKMKLQISKEYSDKEIIVAIKLHEGDQLSGFHSVDAFQYLMTPQLEKLMEPALDCLNEVHFILDELCKNLIRNECRRFPPVMIEIEERVQKVLDNQRDKTRQIIENNLNSSMGYLYTNQTDCFDVSIINQQQNGKVDIQQLLITEMRNRLDTYYRIVVKNLRDQVPKVIGHNFLKWCEEHLQLEMLQQINTSQEIRNLIQEAQQVVEERAQLQNDLEVLQNSIKIIKKDPDLVESLSQKYDESQYNIPEQKDKRQSQNNFVQQQQSNSNTVPKNEAPSVQQSLFGGNQSDQNKTINSGQEVQSKQINFGSQQDRHRQSEQINPVQQNPFLLNDRRQTQTIQPTNQNQKLGDKLIDGAVDSAFANPQFQQGLKNQTEKQAYNAINSQIPIQDKNGRNPLGDFASKQAGKAIEDPKVQQGLKNQVKDQAKDQAAKDKKFLGLF